MKKLLILSAATLCYGMSSRAQATSSANQNVALSLSDAIAITFVTSGTATGPTVYIPFSTVADYTNGVTSSAQQLKVQSNKPFNITVNSNGNYFSYTGSTSPAPQMQVSDALKILVTANGTGGSLPSTSFEDVHPTAESLITGCSRGGNQTFSVQYKATPGFVFPAGTYTTSVIYTATQP